MIHSTRPYLPVSPNWKFVVPFEEIEECCQFAFRARDPKDAPGIVYACTHRRRDGSLDCIVFAHDDLGVLVLEPVHVCGTALSEQALAGRVEFETDLRIALADWLSDIKGWPQY